MISFFQAIVLGLLQGVSELFPISSLGHSVLFAWLVGWNNIVADQSQTESFFLAFLVLLHIGTGVALFVFYYHEWVKIFKGFFKSLARREIRTSSERMAWLLLVATVPAGITGLLFEHSFRTLFGKPFSAAVFLFINGMILLAGDRYMRQHKVHIPRRDYHMESTAHLTAKNLSFKESIFIGFMQIFALFAGISRSGITMVSGLYSGLDYEDAARFSFLLATPIIVGAGILKLPDLFGPLGAGVHGQLIAGGIAAGIAAYFSVKFLDRYFRKSTLRPFAFYCIFAAIASLLVGVLGIRHF